MNHKTYMNRALEIAQRGQGNTGPNPLVGAVLVVSNKIIAEGYHQYHGSHHAEVNAINNCPAELLKKATLYINLEPCCHTKKITPPCTSLILEKKIPKVVIANLDPNPLVKGKGVLQLLNAGVEVTVGIEEEKGRDLNRIFFTNMQHRRPHIILKSAISLDGRIALANGISQWITDKNARLHAQQLRKQVDAIAVGSNTVLLDNPSLTIRGIPLLRRQPKVLVFGRSERFTKEIKIFRGRNPDDVLFLTNHKDLFLLSTYLMEKYQIRSILVEGGAKLLSFFVDQNCFDELNLYQSPILLGNGPVFYQSQKIKDLIKAQRLKLKNIETIGDQVYSRWQNTTHP